MAALTVCDTSKNLFTDLAPEQISELLPDKSRTIWLDLHKPSAHEIQMLREEFGFHPLSIEDATRPHERPKIDVYESYYFIVFYTASYNQQSNELELRALNLFVGPNYLVSVHTGAVRQVEETLRRWQKADSPMGNSVGALVYALLDAVVDDYFPLLDQITDWVEDLEDNIFTNFKDESIQEIFALKKDLLKMRRVVAPERDVINVLLRREVPVFKSEDTIYLPPVCVRPYRARHRQRRYLSRPAIERAR
jgi:magnesium transporter